ncbi:GAF domain-containing protein [Corynebacterium mastitidis]
MGDDRGRVVLSEPLLPRVIAGIRPAWLELGGVAGTLLVAAASFAQGAWRAGCFALGAALTAVAVAVRAYQEARGRRERELWEEHRADQARYLVSNLNMAGVPARAALHMSVRNGRREYLHGARMVVLELARNVIGPGEGVRAHYFGVAEQGKIRLTVPEWGMRGSASRASERVLTGDDESLVRALRGEGWLVFDARELGESYGGLPYRSFAVAPVFAGPRLYGVLTVDAREEKGFTRLDHEVLMNLASTLAVTFAVQGDAPYIDMTKGIDDS